MGREISKITDGEDTDLSDRFKKLDERFPTKLNTPQTETLYGDFTTREAEEFYQPISYSD